jgi:hypothetical protein
MMSSPLAKIIERSIFRIPARRKRKAALLPSEIPTLKGYTARLVDQKWLRLAGGEIMADLRNAARGRECQVRIPAFVMAILKHQFLRISAWRDYAEQASNHQT